MKIKVFLILIIIINNNNNNGVRHSKRTIVTRLDNNKLTDRNKLLNDNSSIYTEHHIASSDVVNQIKNKNIPPMTLANQMNTIYNGSRENNVPLGSVYYKKQMEENNQKKNLTKSLVYSNSDGENNYPGPQPKYIY